MNLPEFREFYAAIHTPVWQAERRYPFAWQERLADEVCQQGWPRCLNIPTGCGKTSLLDIAVFNLVCDILRNGPGRTAPLRVFFVINRRLVVDDVYSHGQKIAAKLAGAWRDETNDAALKTCAAALRELHEYSNPLHVCRLRGGLARDVNWPVPPNLPTICVGTIDQIGSRLLFRSYGASDEAAPIDAGLVGWDSLMIVDEAHLAQPFLETARRVMAHQRHHTQNHPRQLKLVEMSATLAAGGACFSLGPSDRSGAIALRLDRPKFAELQAIPAVAPEQMLAENRRNSAKPEWWRSAEEAFEKKLAEKALELMKCEGGERPQVIAIVVNRVASARKIFRLLKKTASPNGYQPILLTGRTRAFDREDVLRAYLPQLRPDRRQQKERTGQSEPIVVVATQTIEVGADLDFDWLITEMAPLSALRQRFGRLLRLGLPVVQGADAKPVALVALRDARDPGKPPEPDPVYGPTVLDHWNWLNELSGESGTDACGLINFGISALDDLLGVRQAPPEPREHAVPLLPTHLDYLVQTSPRPKPEPETSLYLHGPEPSAPDVYLIWRADLDPEAPSTWDELVRQASPLMPEVLAVPFHAAKTWLLGGSMAKVVVADVDAPGTDATGRRPKGPVLLWKGHNKSADVIQPAEILPGQTLILPALYGGCDEFGWDPESGPVRDVRDEILFNQGQFTSYLQLRCSVAIFSTKYDDFTEWAAHFDDLLAQLDAAEGPTEELQLIRGFRDVLVVGQFAPMLVTQLERLLAMPSVRARPYREDFSGGFVLTGYQSAAGGKRRKPDWRIAPVTTEVDEAESPPQTRSTPILLRDHTRRVAWLATAFCRALGLPKTIRRSVFAAALAHDLGKADRRMQIFFHGNSELAFHRFRNLLAKSLFSERPDQIPEEVRYPRGQRHEMLSVKMIESLRLKVRDLDPILVKYLVGTSHGYARVWPPVCVDLFPIPVQVPLMKEHVAVQSNTDFHLLSSSWMNWWHEVNQTYSPWQAAYLEAILRLSDWFVSAGERL